MILQASQRANGRELASHLMRTDDNEHVEIHEIRGFVSDDLHGAFQEAQAVSRVTKCRQYLFSLSLNPPPQETVSVKAFERAIDRIEQKLGLVDQPRAIVFHEKEARRHAHVVWSRIDGNTLTARQMSHFKVKLRDVSRELYREHGWEMPRGLTNREERNPTNFNLAEWQQAKRTNQDPRQLKAMIQDCWAQSDGLPSFQQALKDKSFWLARGDKRGHVVLDFQGEVHSLSRAISLKAKEVRARLGEAHALPNIEHTKADIAKTMTPMVRRLIEDARLKSKQGMATLAHNRALMVQRHREERHILIEQQEKRRTREARARLERLPKGLSAVWAWATGKLKRVQHRNAHDAEQHARRDAAERQRMREAQLRERRRLQGQMTRSRQREADALVGLRRDLRRYTELSDTLSRDTTRPAQRRSRRRPGLH